MYVERLCENLDRPMVLKGHDESYTLTADEKRKLLKNYIKTIDILERSLSAVGGCPKDRVLELFDQAASLAEGRRDAARFQVNLGL
jgi:hypothetical protein